MAEKNSVSKEEAINQLYETIKTKFEQDGVLKEVRCMLQSKLVSLMKGKSDTGVLAKGPIATETGEKSDMRFQILQQLLMEYLHWHGYQYTAEMLSRESGCVNTPPMRECLEGVVGHFEPANIPILLHIVGQLMQEMNDVSSPSE